MDPKTFELSLEQQFQMKLIEESTQKMSREETINLLIQASRLLMLKDNIIRNLMKQPPLELWG